MSLEQLASDLERDRVIGWIDTSFHDVHRKIRMLVGGDPSVQFGLGDLLPTTGEEVLAALNELSGWDFASGDESRRGSYIEPSGAVRRIEDAAGRLRLACERGERVFFGTGHPTGPLEMYGRIADAMQQRGVDVIRLAEGESFDGYVGGGRITYVNSVACVSMSGDIVHTHSARPMEFLYKNGLEADLVVGDHGFTGAALTREVDAVAIIDTNDPALILAWARGLPVWPFLCDDNRPASAYHAMIDFVLARL